VPGQLIATTYRKDSRPKYMRKRLRPSQLMHEIEPLLGSLRLPAESKVASFDASATRLALDRLDEFLAALSRLRRAASAPKMEEFSLDETVHRCVQEARAPNGIQIQKSGPQPCIAEGDSLLFRAGYPLEPILPFIRTLDQQ
jgi:hypothetical protein